MPKFSFAAFAWAVLYAAVWAGSVWVLSNAGGEKAQEAMVLAPIFAVVGPLMAWGLTAVGRRETVPVPVARPRVEALAVIGYLVVYAALFLGWGLTAVREWFPQEPDREFAISGLKLLAHVILPHLGQHGVLGAYAAIGSEISVGPAMRAAFRARWRVAGSSVVLAPIAQRPLLA